MDRPIGGGAYLVRPRWGAEPARESWYSEGVLGYDVHITRAENWASNEGQEISPEEWLRLVQSDPELIAMPQNGDYFVVWRGSTKYPETWFDWSAGNITTKYPDRATFRKMLQMATALDAKVQGDEGEVYDEASTEDFDDAFLAAKSSASQLGSASHSGWWALLRKLLRGK
jgi:hypothetical protein